MTLFETCWPAWEGPSGEVAGADDPGPARVHRPHRREEIHEARWVDQRKADVGISSSTRSPFRLPRASVGRSAERVLGAPRSGGRPTRSRPGSPPVLLVGLNALLAQRDAATAGFAARPDHRLPIFPPNFSNVLARFGSCTPLLPPLTVPQWCHLPLKDTAIDRLSLGEVRGGASRELRGGRITDHPRLSGRVLLGDTRPSWRAVIESRRRIHFPEGAFREEDPA